ncbi:MAG TPA: rhomboid family intramembrane serine protease [Gallionella sp.]|nr:rhomboid family intramembrane serine protease [Gallionella sp.]
MQFYFSSGLPDWELSRYSKYLEAEGSLSEREEFNGMLARHDRNTLPMMEHDTKFMRELHAGRIVTPQDAEFATWTTQRSEYEAKRSFTDRYVYQVDDPGLLTATTSGFMHGSFGHLFGNMVVLFLVGFLVESVVGKALYALAYMVSIYAAIFVFSLTAHGGSLLGASGAIAGVMGLYSVIFGFRKIDFFYSLGFYFDYVKAPAILLLPLWLGNELYQFLSEQGAQIAYMAHFGGLVCGAIMGALYRWQRPTLIESRHEEAESKEMDGQTFQRGMDLLGAMEFQKALAVFKSLQEKHPQDMDLARLIYRAAKSDPSSEDYHRAALRLLALPEMDAATSNQAHGIFHEYLDCAKPAPRLGHDLIAKLAKRFAGISHSDDAEKLANLLQRLAPQHGELPSVLLALARGYYREQRKDKFEAILKSLISQFPQSKEAEAAAGMLRVG